MKKITLLLFLVIFTKQLSLGQVSGNVNYLSQNRNDYDNSNLNFPANSDVIVSVKGMANVKADAYVAVFSVTQVGKSAEEANSLMNERINQVSNNIKTKTGVQIYVDMISFVPTYEYEVEKKMFSKKTYNEIPSGFELKKNIHIQYTNPTQLDEIMTILSGAEIYDLVKVDYFSNNMENIKKELMSKAKSALQEKLKNYQSVMGGKLDSISTQLVDEYRVKLPVEMYKSYQAYASSSLNVKRSVYVNDVDKSTTLYYQPVSDKEFDFVMNPVIFEPVIQVMYEVKLSVKKDQSRKNNTEYLLVTPNGDLKKLTTGSK